MERGGGRGREVERERKRGIEREIGHLEGCRGEEVLIIARHPLEPDRQVHLVQVLRLV